jgi:hypothetical protein
MGASHTEQRGGESGVRCPDLSSSKLGNFEGRVDEQDIKRFGHEDQIRMKAWHGAGYLAGAHTSELSAHLQKTWAHKVLKPNLRGRANNTCPANEGWVSKSNNLLCD